MRRDGRARSVLLKTAAGGERELACGQVLVATGRRPVSAGLNLPAVGVRTGSRGEIVTDTRQRTGNPRIWAAGDATGGPPYVRTAAAQGSVAAGNALFHSEREVDYTALPRVTFTSPAIASAGLTEAELVRSGVTCDCRVGMTVSELAGTWAPYLTMSEALRLAAQSFSRDVTRLSCCAA